MIKQLIDLLQTKDTEHSQVDFVLNGDIMNIVFVTGKPPAPPGIITMEVPIEKMLEEPDKVLEAVKESYEKVLELKQNGPPEKMRFMCPSSKMVH